MRQVLLFDSGVGGWSVARKLLRTYRAMALTYLADNGGFPYGNRSAESLAARVDALLRQLTQNFAPDLIVCACNTVSTTVLGQLRRQFSCPIVGVQPALAPAVTLSRNGVVGLLATPGTISSAYVADQVRRHADIQVRRLGCAKLASLAENKMAGLAIDSNELRSCIAPLLQSTDTAAAPDVIVLGCTHFPLLLTELRQAAGDSVRWFDPADELLSRLLRMGFNASPRDAYVSADVVIEAPQHRLVLTGPQRAIDLQRIFQGWGFSTVEMLDPTIRFDAACVCLPSDDDRVAALG